MDFEPEVLDLEKSKSKNFGDSLKWIRKGDVFTLEEYDPINIQNNPYILDTKCIKIHITISKQDLEEIPFKFKSNFKPSNRFLINRRLSILKQNYLNLN